MSNFQAINVFLVIFFFNFTLYYQLEELLYDFLLIWSKYVNFQILKFFTTSKWSCFNPLTANWLIYRSTQCIWKLQRAYAAINILPKTLCGKSQCLFFCDILASKFYQFHADSWVIFILLVSSKMVNLSMFTFVALSIHLICNFLTQNLQASSFFCMQLVLNCTVIAYETNTQFCSALYIFCSFEKTSSFP